jgi:hypothetical protein
MTRLDAPAEAGAAVLSGQKAELLKLFIEERKRRSQVIQPQPRWNAAAGTVFATTWAQRRLWFIDHLEGGSAGYQVPLAVRMRGVLDRRALRSALDALVQRHEALRTVFVTIDGEPMQQIAIEARFELLTIDLSGVASAEREAQIRSHQLAEVHDRFDLRNGPLIRGRLLCLHDDEHVLLITVHHIVVDGWSKGVLMRELAALYAAYREQQGHPLKPLPVQYADYAQWQRQQWSAGAALNAQLAYWRERLAGAPSQLALSANRVEGAPRPYHGERVPVGLDARLSAKLKAFAQRQHMTLFMILFAAWSILLAKRSNSEDLVIGSPIANRRRPEVEGLIGLFVNPLALRVRVRDDMLLGELLEQVKEVTLGAYDHQDVPFEKIVEALQPQRNFSRSPLFQVVLVFHNEPAGALPLPGLTVTPEFEVDEPAMIDLLLSLEERGNEIVGSLYYVTDLFDRDTMTRWVAAFRTLLDSLTDVHRHVADLKRSLGDLTQGGSP